MKAINCENRMKDEIDTMKSIGLFIGSNGGITMSHTRRSVW